MELTKEVVERIEGNRKQASQYGGDYIPGAQPEDCTVAPTLVARDRCEWTNKLLGIDTRDALLNIGAPIAARACITNPAPNVYIVAVAWQGVLPTRAPESACGQNQVHPAANRPLFSPTVQN